MRRSKQGTTAADDGNAHDDINIMDWIAVTRPTNISNPSDGNITRLDDNKHSNDIVTDFITDTGSFMSDTPSTSNLQLENMSTVYVDCLRQTARINAVLRRC